MDYKWPVDQYGNRKSIRDFSDLEQIRYQVYMARVECSIGPMRYIGQEILYLHNWSVYFRLLSKKGEFDPEAVKYLDLEIVRLYKERVGWN